MQIWVQKVAATNYTNLWRKQILKLLDVASDFFFYLVSVKFYRVDYQMFDGGGFNVWHRYGLIWRLQGNLNNFRLFSLSWSASCIVLYRNCYDSNCIIGYSHFCLSFWFKMFVELIKIKGRFFILCFNVIFYVAVDAGFSND